MREGGEGKDEKREKDSRAHHAVSLRGRFRTSSVRGCASECASFPPLISLIYHIDDQLQDRLCRSSNCIDSSARCVHRSPFLRRSCLPRRTPRHDDHVHSPSSIVSSLAETTHVRRPADNLLPNLRRSHPRPARVGSRYRSPPVTTLRYNGVSSYCDRGNRPMTVVHLVGGQGRRKKSKGQRGTL